MLKELTPKQIQKIKAMEKTIWILWGELDIALNLDKIDLSRLRVLIKRLNKHYDDFKNKD